MTTPESQDRSGDGFLSAFRFRRIAQGGRAAKQFELPLEA